MKRDRSALGRGLSALLPTTPTGVIQCPVDRIAVRDTQPRRRFDDQATEELAASIRESGVLQPLLVSQDGDRYRLIAGERRLRAARLAGLTSVPVVVRQTTEEGAFLLALVENLQRQDLNPVEQARAFHRLVEEFGLTQDDVARRVGKQRSTVANALRLLKLSEPVLDAIESGRLAEGTARALIPLSPDQQVEALERIQSQNLNTREVEAMVKGIRQEARPSSPQGDSALDQYYEQERGQLEAILSLPVRITARGNRGHITISFTSIAAFGRISRILRAGAKAISDDPNA